MKKLVEKGIVAYFDILGYQNFLINNNINDCIDKIEGILVKLPVEIETDFFHLKDNSSIKAEEYYEYKKKLVDIRKDLINHLNTLFISDTIIFFFDIANIKNNIPFCLQQMLVYLIIFMKLSFENGFPMRGFVDYGEYYFNNDVNINIIAGKTIVKCHQETSAFDFSGLVIDDSVRKYCMNFNYDILNLLFDKKVIADYLVNLKNKEDHKYVCNFIIDGINENLDQYIFNSFHKHNKEISNEVMKKINNTENIMKHFLYNNNNISL